MIPGKSVNPAYRVGVVSELGCRTRAIAGEETTDSLEYPPPLKQRYGVDRGAGPSDDTERVDGEHELVTAFLGAGFS